MRPAKPPPRPWAPQFGPSVPPINNRHFITHACWRMGPRDSVCVAALFHCERARVTFCLERKAETVLQRKRPFASSCDCASGILRPSVRRPVQRCTSSSLSRHSKDLQRPLSSVKHGAGGRKGMPRDILRTRWRPRDKFCKGHIAILPKEEKSE